MNVAKTTQALYPIINGNEDLEEKTRQLMKRLEEDQDVDVQFFAYKT
jgi:hypothetical protein